MTEILTLPPGRARRGADGRHPVHGQRRVNWSWSIFTERMGTCLTIVWGVFAINFMIGSR